MAKARSLGYRVDFMAVHYYSRNGRVRDFEDWLRQVYSTYKRPVWVTEWCHVDWNRPRAITAVRNAQFAKEALPMLDALPFIERHAWFAANPYELYGAQHEPYAGWESLLHRAGGPSPRLLFGGQL
jgi:hypothetical protein